MKNIFLSFPGQGSQSVGMGKSILESPFKSIANKKFEIASEVLGYDVKNLCLEGPEEKLKLTEYTQPLIFTISCICSDIVTNYLKNLEIHEYTSLGHSIGEYAALYSQEVIRFKDGVILTSKRGKAMQNATPIGVGSMHAILRVDEKVIKEICQEVSDDNFQVVPANFNTPGQIVISGHKEACDKFLKYLDENYEAPYRTVELKVSAPFHSPLMKKAQDEMKDPISDLELGHLKFQYIANVNSEIVSSKDQSKIKNNLIQQISSPVLWTQSVMRIPEDSITIDMGPGSVTSALIKKTNRSLRVVSFEKESIQNLDLDSFTRLLEI